MVNKARLIETIADHVKNKRIEGISDLRDESDRNGMHFVIELKRDANPQVVLNQLYSFTQMQDTVGVIMLALVDGQPKVLTLKECLEYYIKFQSQVIRELAAKESCIFVGRAAGYVLEQCEEIEHLVRIFVYADKIKKVQRAMEVDLIDEEKAKKRVKKLDRERKEYYKYFTGKEWHNIKNYDLPINSTRLSLDEIAELIKTYIRLRGFME